MKKLFVIFSCIMIIAVSCGPTSKNSDSTSDTGDTRPDSAMVPIDEVPQVVGVAIINRGPSDVEFTLDPSEYQMPIQLRPGESHDFPITGDKAMLKFKGNSTSWEVQRHQRYQVLYDEDNADWVIEIL